MADYWQHMFPPGYRFVPTNEELIEYLVDQVTGRELPSNTVLAVDIYEDNPQQIFESHKLSKEKEWYFFTLRNRKYANGNRPNRAAGDGYWKATGGDKEIYRNGRKVGYMKSLTFFRGTSKTGVKTDWLMYEYRLHDQKNKFAPTTYNRDKLDACVLCKVYCKRPSQAARARNNGRQEDNIVPVVQNREVLPNASPQPNHGGQHRPLSPPPQLPPPPSLSLPLPPPQLQPPPPLSLPLPLSSSVSHNFAGGVYSDTTMDELLCYVENPSAWGEEMLSNEDPQQYHGGQCPPSSSLSSLNSSLQLLSIMNQENPIQAPSDMTLDEWLTWCTQRNDDNTPKAHNPQLPPPRDYTFQASVLLPLPPYGMNTSDANPCSIVQSHHTNGSGSTANAMDCQKCSHQPLPLPPSATAEMNSTHDGEARSSDNKSEFETVTDAPRNMRADDGQDFGQAIFAQLDEP